jgi:hypothetical protein
VVTSACTAVCVPESECSQPVERSSGRGGRLGRLGWLVELLDAGGQLEVTVGQATLGVAGQARVTLFQRISMSGW